jgi:hypothetical protein
MEIEQQGKIQAKQSFLVVEKFIKFDEWGTFDKCGSISDEGMEHIENYIQDKMPITFSEYWRNLHNSNLVDKVDKK